MYTTWITCTAHGYHMYTTWISHVQHMNITCTPRGYHMYSTGISHVQRMNIKCSLQVKMQYLQLHSPPPWRMMGEAKWGKCPGHYPVEVTKLAGRKLKSRKLVELCFCFCFFCHLNKKFHALLVFLLHIFYKSYS